MTPKFTGLLESLISFRESVFSVIFSGVVDGAVITGGGRVVIVILCGEGGKRVIDLEGRSDYIF